MKVILAAVADYGSVSIDNKLNILGVFQEINASVFPAMTAPIYLVLSLEAEPEEYGRQLPIRVALLGDSGNGDELLVAEGLAQVPQPRHPGDRVFSNQVIGWSGVTFERPGNYRFSVSIEDKEIAVVPVSVKQLK
jgi:hypothetical protein